MHQITVQQAISHTPQWVWILLVALIVMGVKNSREKPVVFSRMFIAPVIFMVWGLNTITQFNHKGFNLISYIIFIIPGLFIGYLLNRAFQSFYKNGSVLYKKQSYLPLFVVLINFLAKYALNIMLLFYQGTFFHIIFSATNGLTVGLFFGGILYTVQMQNQLRTFTVRS